MTGEREVLKERGGKNSQKGIPTSINEMRDAPFPMIALPSEAIVGLRLQLLQWTKYKLYFIQKSLYVAYGFKYLSFYVIATMFR